MKKRKNKIIAIMIVIMLVMAVGYSYFATSLNINATGSIDSSWNVYFSKIEVGTKSSGANTKSTPSVSATTANMDVSLKSPGDYINFNITLVNGGSVDAIIEDIEATAEGTEAIIFSISGIKIGDKLAGGSNASKVITIKMEYDTSVTSQPSELTKKLTVNIDAVQDIGQLITIKDPIITTKLSSKILSDNVAYADNVASPYVTSSTGIDFSKPSSDTNGKGLYYTSTNTEGNNTTYYFRGDVNNNYVNFVNNNTGCGYCLGGYVQFSYYDEDYCNDGVCYPNVVYEDFGTYDDCLIGQNEKISEGYNIDNSCYCTDGAVKVLDSENNTIYDKETCEQISKEVTSVCFNWGYYEARIGLTDEECYNWGGEIRETGEPIRFVEEDGVFLTWRIVRINEDGSIRLVLSDNPYLDTSFKTDEDNAYVGYMYGATGASTYTLTHTNTNDSEVKQEIDKWYKYGSSLSNYSHLLADAGFCNDRSIASSAGSWHTSDTALGYGKNTTYYGAYNRLVNLNKPQFACPNSNDLFTLKGSSKGNKALTYPIGMLTADEVVYAGYSTSTESDSYLNKYVGTMTPYNVVQSTTQECEYRSAYEYYGEGDSYHGPYETLEACEADGGAEWGCYENEYAFSSCVDVPTASVIMFSIENKKLSSSTSVSGYVYPVINLKADVFATGSGTKTDPYVVQTN